MICSKCKYDYEDEVLFADEVQTIRETGQCYACNFIEFIMRKTRKEDDTPKAAAISEVSRTTRKENHEQDQDGDRD